MVRRLKTLLYYYDSEWGEGFSALGAMAWGLWLLAPFWDTFQSSRSFFAMAALAPEWLWGLFMVSLGSIGLYGLLADSHRFRVISAGLMFSAWAFLSAMFAVSNISATSFMIYSLVAAMTGLAFYRLLQGR